MPSEVEISVSPELQGFFRYTGDAAAHEETVDLDTTIRKISDFNAWNVSKAFDAGALLRDCKVMARSHVKVGNTSEEISDIARLRLEQEERRYQASVREIKMSRHGNLIRDEIKELRETHLVAWSFFLSFLGSFLFGYFASQIFLAWRFEYCVFAGVISAAAVLVIEAALFVIRDEKKRRKPKEL